MKVLFLLALFASLSNAQDCMSSSLHKRCLPKEEAGDLADHPWLYQDGDPCFSYYANSDTSYGTFCYTGDELDFCDMSAPGCGPTPDCMTTSTNKRCLPKAEAGNLAEHPFLYQDGDPCFNYYGNSDTSYGTYCYTGDSLLDFCNMSAPGCSGPSVPITTTIEPTTTTTEAPIINTGDCPNQAQYCTLGEDNTMCKYCGIGATCNDAVISNEMNDAMKTELLDKHNELRAKVANGNEDGQPSATNMNKLEWDDELASNAQLWADQCPDGSWVVSDSPPHDPNRNTIVYDGHVGQNMADSWNSQDNMVWGLSTKVQAWYDEVKDWPAGNVGAFSNNGATGVIGHYTQVIWAETKKVGCGVIYYRDQSDFAANYPYRKV